MLGWHNILCLKTCRKVSHVMTNLTCLFLFVHHHNCGVWGQLVSLGLSHPMFVPSSWDGSEAKPGE